MGGGEPERGDELHLGRGVPPSGRGHVSYFWQLGLERLAGFPGSRPPSCARPWWRFMAGTGVARSSVQILPSGVTCPTTGRLGISTTPRSLPTASPPASCCLGAPLRTKALIRPDFATNGSRLSGTSAQFCGTTRGGGVTGHLLVLAPTRGAGQADLQSRRRQNSPQPVVPLAIPPRVLKSRPFLPAASVRNRRHRRRRPPRPRQPWSCPRPLRPPTMRGATSSYGACARRRPRRGLRIWPV